MAAKPRTADTTLGDADRREAEVPERRGDGQGARGQAPDYLEVTKVPFLRYGVISSLTKKIRMPLREQ